MMGKQIYGIPKDWLLALMKSMQGLHTKNDIYIPKDAKIVGVEYNTRQDMILLVLESEKFTEQEIGTEVLPSVPWGE